MSPGRGIPERLATERAANIRALRYELSFRIEQRLGNPAEIGLDPTGRAAALASDVTNATLGMNRERRIRPGDFIVSSSTICHNLCGRRVSF